MTTSKLRLEIATAYSAGVQAREKKSQDQERDRRIMRETEAAQYRDAALLWIRNVVPTIARSCGAKDQKTYTVSLPDFIGYEVVPLWVIADLLKPEAIKATVLFGKQMELEFYSVL